MVCLLVDHLHKISPKHLLFLTPLPSFLLLAAAGDLFLASFFVLLARRSDSIASLVTHTGPSNHSLDYPTLLLQLTSLADVQTRLEVDPVSGDPDVLT